MAWTTGTTSNGGGAYRHDEDLLDKLRVFVSTTMTPIGERWTVNRWDTTGDPVGRVLFLQGPGLAASDEIYVGIRCYAETFDAYCWQLVGATGYYSNAAFDRQPNPSPVGSDYGPVMYTYDTPMKYWFIANGRRIIVVVEVNGVYHMCYLGLMEQMYDPDIFGYPIIVGGSGHLQDGRFSGDNGDYCGFFSPTSSSLNQHVSSLQARAPDGRWRYASNSSTSSDNEISVYPLISETLGTGKYVEAYMKPTSDGEYSLRPFTVIYGDEGAVDHWHLNRSYPMGEFDGVRHITGTGGLTSEDTATVGGDTWLIVQNIWRSGIDDFVAVRLV